MSFEVVRSGEPIPIYNGKDYPYWKDKMKRNIMAINSAAWQVVLNGFTVVDVNAITPAEAKLFDLDSEVWVFITNHLTPEKYHEVKNIPSAKGVWDYLEKVYPLRKMPELTLSEANFINSRETRVKKSTPFTADSLLMQMS